MESVIETKASMILQFIDGLRGDVHVTFEEGTSAAWLYDLLKPHVTKLVVCDPRKNKSMREGNQSDKIDARRLAELLRLDHLTPVYHGEHGLRTLKETYNHRRIYELPDGRWRDVPSPCRSSLVASILSSLSGNERATVAFNRVSQYLRVGRRSSGTACARSVTSAFMRRMTCTLVAP